MRIWTVHTRPDPRPDPGGPMRAGSVPAVGEGAASDAMAGDGAAAGPGAGPRRVPGWLAGLGRQRGRPTPPVLVPEAIAWRAMLVPPLFFLAQRMWVVLSLWVAVWVLILRLAPEEAASVALPALHVLTGLLAHDLQRWSLAQRGYQLQHVIAAADEDQALARLITHRPDLARAVAF